MVFFGFLPEPELATKMSPELSVPCVQKLGCVSSWVAALAVPAGCDKQPAMLYIHIYTYT